MIVLIDCVILTLLLAGGGLCGLYVLPECGGNVRIGDAHDEQRDDQEEHIQEDGKGTLDSL